MSGGFVVRVFLVLVVLAIVAGIGVAAYNAGWAQGLAASTQEGAVVAPYAYQPFYFPGFGFALFCLVPVLLFLLFPLFGLWRGPWGRGWHRYSGEWGQRVPPPFEEWHRRAHEAQPAQPAPQ